MKKYIKPVTVVVELDNMGIIATSPGYYPDKEANGDVGALINRERGNAWAEYENN